MITYTISRRSFCFPRQFLIQLSRYCHLYLTSTIIQKDGTCFLLKKSI